MNRSGFPMVLVLSAIIAAACGPTPTPTPAGGPSQVWINSPQNGEVLPLNSEMTFNFQAASFTEVTQFEMTFCDSDEIGVTIEPNHTGEGGPYGTMYYTEDVLHMTPDEAGDCTYKVRAKGTGPQYSPWAQVHVFFGQAPGPANPGVIAISSPTIWILPLLPTDTPAPLLPFEATALMNANCRAGPSTSHNEWGYALKGDMVEVVGRNEDGTWLNVLNPHAAGKCWLSIMALDVPFEVKAVPVASYPTPPPSAEGGEEQQGCLITSSASGALVCVAPCPAGAIPGSPCTP